MTSILVICTGNICRSPIAEGLLRDALRAPVRRRRRPSVSSAGTSGLEGSGAMPESVQAAAELGVDIAGHVARRLTPDIADGADLLLCMAREHRDMLARCIRSRRSNVHPEGARSAAWRPFRLRRPVRGPESLSGTPRGGEPRPASRCGADVQGRRHRRSARPAVRGLPGHRVGARDVDHATRERAVRRGRRRRRGAGGVRCGSRSAPITRASRSRKS